MIGVQFYRDRRYATLYFYDEDSVLRAFKSVPEVWHIATMIVHEHGLCAGVGLRDVRKFSSGRNRLECIRDILCSMWSIRKMYEELIDLRGQSGDECDIPDAVNTLTSSLMEVGKLEEKLFQETRK